MSLFERVRRVPGKSPSPDALGGIPLLVSSAAAGASAALVSVLIVSVPLLLAWVASPQSTVTWSRALSVGGCLWLLGNGATLTTGSAAISLSPLLLTVIGLAIATTAARRILRRLDDERPHRLDRMGGLRRDVAASGLIFTASYAGVGLLVALSTASRGLQASPLRSVLGTALMGVVSVLLALALEFAGEIATVAPGLVATAQTRLPRYLVRAIRPGLWGAVTIFGAGLVLTIVMMVTQMARIGRLYDALGADPVGVVALTLGQLMVLPNVALWAASWIAGPGFGLGEGTAVTWSQSSTGLLPLVPGLGALPASGPLPSGLWLSFLLPVATGVLVGWRAMRTVTRLSSWQVKARTAASACAFAALLLTVACALAGGSLGSGRLSALGAPSLLFGVTVLGELLLGAAVVVYLSHLRATRS
jgi:hypothetical protein